MTRIVYRPKMKPAPEPRSPSPPTPTKIVKNRKRKRPVGLTRYWQDKLKPSSGE